MFVKSSYVDEFCEFRPALSFDEMAFPAGVVVPGAGGVQIPTHRFSTIMIPKCMGFIPSWAVTMGRKMGVKISTAGVISIKIPTKSRMKLINRRITTGLSLRLNSPLLTFWGIFS